MRCSAIAKLKEYKVTVNYLDEAPPEWRWDIFNATCVNALLRIAERMKEDEETKAKTC